MTVDLNAVRAARREALGDGPKVKIGKRTFTCPPELPFDALVAGGRAEQGDAGATYELVAELLGDDGLAALRAWKPSVEEMTALVSGLMEEYGSSTNGDGDDSGKAQA